MDKEKQSDCKALERPVQDRMIRSAPESREGESAGKPGRTPNASRDLDVTKRRPNSLSRSILPLLVVGLVGLIGRVGNGATVTGTLGDIGLSGLRTKITFTPTNDVLVAPGFGLSAGPAKTIDSTNDGSFSVVLDAGDYMVGLPLVSWRRPFGISVPRTNATLNITNLLSGPRTYTYTNLLTAVTGLTSDDQSVTITAVGGGVFDLAAQGGGGSNSPSFIQATNIAASVIARSNYMAAVQGQATNATLRHLVATNASSTASIYTLGSEDARENGTWFLASQFDVSGGGDFVPCYTNSSGNGYAVIEDGSISYFEIWTMVSTTNGTPDDLPIIATLNQFQPQGVWTSQNFRRAPTGSGWGTFAPSLVFVNPPVGDGGLLTNVNARAVGGNLNGVTNITVAGPVAASGSVTSSGSVTASGDVRGTNVLGNVAAATGFGGHGGEIWGNAPQMLAMVTTYGTDPVNPSPFSNSDPRNNGPHELTMTNIIRYYNRIGWTAAMKAHGLQPYLHLDVGLLYPFRDASGQLGWNTNKIPDGVPWLCNYAATNGGWVVGTSDYFSGKKNPFSGGLFDPVMTVDTASQDIARLKSWGLKVIRLSGGSPNGAASYQQEMMRAVADAVLFPNDLPATQTNRGGMIIDGDSPDVMTKSVGYFFNSRWSDQGVGSGGTKALRALSQMRIGEFGDGTATGSMEVHSQSGKGHQVGYNIFYAEEVDNLAIDELRTPYSCLAVFPEKLNFQGTNLSATLLLHVTNDAYLTILGDPLGLPGAIVEDNGASSTLKAARPLTNGFAVLLRNDGASSSNMVINWSQVRSPDYWSPIGSALARWSLASDVPCSVDHVFGNGGAATNCGVFIGGFTATVAAGRSELFRLTPQAISPQTLTNSPVPYADNVTGGYVASVGGVQGALNSINVASSGSASAHQALADDFVGGGANLTSLNASQLTSGTLPDARFPATLPAVDGHLLTGLSSGGGPTGTVLWYTNSPATQITNTFNGQNFWIGVGGQSGDLHMQNLSAASANFGSGSVTAGSFSGSGTSLSGVGLLGSANVWAASNAIPGRFEGSGILLTNVHASSVDLTPLAWGGPSNTVTFTNSYYVFTASSDVLISNVNGLATWATLAVSNSAATNITIWTTNAGYRAIGSGTTNALAVPSGKVGVWSGLKAFGTMYGTAVQQ